MYWTFIMNSFSETVIACSVGDEDLQTAIDWVNSPNRRNKAYAVYDKYGKIYYAREL